jgi:hypothetical protein
MKRMGSPYYAPTRAVLWCAVLASKGMEGDNRYLGTCAEEASMDSAMSLSTSECL